MNQKLEEQKQLTDTLIMEMTTQKYRAKYQNLFTFETIGGVICYAFAAYILINFGKLDIWYLRLCGILAIVVLTVLPIFSIKSIIDLKNLPIAGNSQKDLLEEFGRRERTFLLLQQLNVAMSGVLMVVALPIFSWLFNGKDIFTESQAMFWYVPIGIIVLILMFTRVFKCYRSINASAAKTLEDLE